jgi:hypothetical protein
MTEYFIQRTAGLVARLYTANAVKKFFSRNGKKGAAAKRELKNGKKGRKWKSGEEHNNNNGSDGSSVV